MKNPLILLPMLTVLLAPIEQASAFFCAICDGHEIPLMDITGSRKSKLSDNVGSDLGKKSKLSDNVGSDLGKSAAGQFRKILGEPRVLDNIAFGEGSTASGGQVRKSLKEPHVLDNIGFGEGSTASGCPAAGNYRFVLDGIIRNEASDFTSPRNCGGEGDNHVPDAGSTVMLMGLALTVLVVGRRRSLLAKSRASLNPHTLWRLMRSNSVCWHHRCKLTSPISEPTRRFTQRPKA